MTLLQTGEYVEDRVVRRVACAMGLYTISFLLLAWPLYYLVPEILFPVSSQFLATEVFEWYHSWALMWNYFL